MEPVDPRMVRFFNALLYSSTSRRIVAVQDARPIQNLDSVFWEDLKPFGRRGGLLQGSLNEVSLALVGVASPA